jgi:hypothetical protein
MATLSPSISEVVEAKIGLQARQFLLSRFIEADPDDTAGARLHLAGIIDIQAADPAPGLVNGTIDHFSHSGGPCSAMFANCTDG